MPGSVLGACLMLVADSAALSQALHAPWTPEGITAADTVVIQGALADTPQLLRLSYVGDDGTEADIYMCAGNALALPLTHDFSDMETTVRDMAGEDVAADFVFSRSGLTAITDGSGRPQLQFEQTVTMEADGHAYTLSSVYYEYLVNPDSTLTMMSAHPLMSDLPDLMERYTFEGTSPAVLPARLMPPRAGVRAALAVSAEGIKNGED